VIIQCKECGTKYRFDKSQIEGEGIWVRCSHCEAVFFQENPLAEIASLTDSIEPGEVIHEKTYKESAEDIDRMFMEVEGEGEVDGGERKAEYEGVHSEEEENKGGAEDIDGISRKDETEDAAQNLEKEEVYGDAGEIIENAEASEGEAVAQNPRSPGRKVAIVLILVILLSGGIYLWTSPRVTEVISNGVLPRVEKFIRTLPGAEKFLGTEKDIPEGRLSELGVNLINVRERFVKNWVAGDIMLVEGFAVNNNKCAVSDIRVRGKILDSSGNILAEVESNCGNILTDDELKNLTEKEIMKELSNPYGRNFSNTGIEPGADIPFMLAFVMPADEASEFLVELVGIEAAETK